MADDNEILSPPFPRDTTTLPRLLTCLSELRGWLLEHRFWANETYANLGGDGDVIPLPEHLPQIPDASRYQAISVQDIFQTYMMLRKLREEWDAMVRVYEEDWQARPAVAWRLRILRTGYAILVNAFVDPETREAHNETFARKVKKVQLRIFKKLGIDKEVGRSGAFGMAADGSGFGLDMTEPLKKDDIDFDALFHGDSSEPGESDFNDADDDQGDT